MYTNNVIRTKALKLRIKIHNLTESLHTHKKKNTTQQQANMTIEWDDKIKRHIHGGIRTHDLRIRSPARYPLRYADTHTFISKNQQFD